MSSDIVLSVGISGCGKSTAWKNLYSDYILIEPDQIRIEFTGSVSDQSKNKEVFEEAYRRLVELVKKGKNVYWSATNLNMKSINSIIDTARQIDPDVTFTILVFSVSSDWKTCRDRVKADISSGVERSDTWNIFVDDNTTGKKIPLIKSMSDRFNQLIKSKDFLNLGLKDGIEIKSI